MRSRKRQILIILALAAIAVAGYVVYTQSPSHKVRKFLGAEAVSILSKPTRVQAYRLSGRRDRQTIPSMDLT